MQAPSSLEQLHRLGVAVEVDEDDLVCTPASSIPPELRPVIRKENPLIISYLTGQCIPCTCDGFIITFKAACPVCDAGICAACGTCLPAGWPWRRQSSA